MSRHESDISDPVLDESAINRVLDAQPFASKNDARRVWQLFKDDVHVTDAIRGIIAALKCDSSHHATQIAVATVCLVGERYAHGHMVSVELQLASEYSPAPKIGDRYYIRPQSEIYKATGATP